MIKFHLLFLITFSFCLFASDGNSDHESAPGSVIQNRPRPEVNVTRQAKTTKQYSGRVAYEKETAKKTGFFKSKIETQTVQVNYRLEIPSDPRVAASAKRWLGGKNLVNANISDAEKLTVTYNGVAKNYVFISQKLDNQKRPTELVAKAYTVGKNGSISLSAEEVTISLRAGTVTAFRLKLANGAAGPFVGASAGSIANRREDLEPVLQR